MLHNTGTGGGVRREKGSTKNGRGAMDEQRRVGGGRGGRWEGEDMAYGFRPKAFLGAAMKE